MTILSPAPHQLEKNTYKLARKVGLLAKKTDNGFKLLDRRTKIIVATDLTAAKAIEFCKERKMEKETYFLHVDPFSGEERRYPHKPPKLRCCLVEILKADDGEICERTYTFDNGRNGEPVRPQCGREAEPWTRDDEAPPHHGSTAWVRVRANTGRKEP